jgi:hypothetical protein
MRGGIVVASKTGYQDISDRLNGKWFMDALETCENNFNWKKLSPRERVFVGDMRAGWDLFMAEFKPTTKQFNWLRQLAVEVVTR